jgi:ABC-type sugar transport system permease subunit
MFLKASSRIGQRRLTAIFLVSPAIISVLLVMGYGIFMAGYTSLHKVDYMLGSKEFVGLSIYLNLFRDPRFLNSLSRSLILTVGTVSLGILISLGSSVLLNKVRVMNKFLNTLSLFPWLVSAVAVAVMFRFIFVGNSGLANILLEKLGLPPVWWFTNPTLTMIILIIAICWYNTPLAILVLLGGLKTIDNELYDSASLDGASTFQMFRMITVPLIKPMIKVSLIWLTFASFNQFSVVLPATGGGPGNSTEVLALVMYRYAFNSLDYSSAYAVTIILMLINIIASILYSFVFREKD